MEPSTSNGCKYSAIGICSNVISSQLLIDTIVEADIFCCCEVLTFLLPHL